MSVLTVAQAVAKKIGVAVPETVASNTNREIVELFEIMNEMGERIMRGHDWRLLMTLETITGDGSTEDHDMPADYDRMINDAKVWSSSLETPLSHIISVDDWLGLDIQSFDFVVNAWTLYGGQLHIKPALATGVTAKYYYISNKFAKDSGGTAKAAFTADTDEFRLDEQLLKLACIWAWKESKGQSYAEPMMDYEFLLERLVARDGGSRDLVVGRRGRSNGVKTAYPKSITVS
jgi:hypothetical protein